MNILIVTQYFWPENFKINDLAIGLKELKNEVTILTGKPNYPDGRFFKGYNFFNKREEYFQGIRIVRSNLVSRGKGKGLRLFINYFSFAFFASFTAIFRLNRKADVIFVYEPSPITVGIPAIVYKHFSKAPIFFWVQDLWPESLSAAGKMNSKLILKILERLVKYIYKKSDIIFISSKSFKESIIEKGVSSHKIKYLPNWAEDIFLSEVGRDEKIIKLLPSTGFKIIFAGNVGDAQDFESIIKAVEITKSFENIHWIIIGEGRKKVWVEEQKYEKQLTNLHLLGRFPISLMPYFYREADVLLVSLRSDEIFAKTVPAKIQTYLACGKPIIAMISGEGAEIVNEAKAGFSMDAGEYKILAEKVLKMYYMPKEELEYMASSAKEYYAIKFNRKKLIDNVLSEFTSYLTK